MNKIKTKPKIKPTKKARLIRAHGYVNKAGDLCGLCDGTHAHTHPRHKCTKCGEIGLSENMVGKHVCKPKVRIKTPDDLYSREEAEETISGQTEHDAMCQQLEEQKRQIEQLGINQRWLIQQFDALHTILCPGQFGTWQERAVQCVTQTTWLVEALKPFIHFIEQWDRAPLGKIANEFYGIHNGTKFEAKLRLSDFGRIRDLLSPLSAAITVQVIINGREVVLSAEDSRGLTYERVVELADTKWGKEALHTVTYWTRGTNDGGSLAPGIGKMVVPRVGMVITAVVTAGA
jgi:hypothetical protein